MDVAEHREAVRVAFEHKTAGVNPAFQVDATKAETEDLLRAFPCLSEAYSSVEREDVRRKPGEARRLFIHDISELMR